MILSDISLALQSGRAPAVAQLARQALDEGIPAASVLNEGLLSGMDVIGQRFRENKIFVPNVLLAARAMNAGVEILKPCLRSEGVSARGRVILGTVKGDLHDIGKNLVRIMLEGKGFEVIDLGVDVVPEVFVQRAMEENARIICCSALLTTTMPMMEKVVQAAREAGIRDKVKIMVGGAPVDPEFARRIGADVYTPDAASCADAAVLLVKED